MDCLNCHAELVELYELFFFCKNEKDVHLSIKPEVCKVVLQRKTLKIERESKKKVRVKCNNCFHNLGCHIPYGPNGTSFFAFACDKIKLNGKKFKKDQRWWKMYSDFKQRIDTRDMATFFNEFNVSQSIEKKRKIVTDTTINFPSLQNLNDFEWFSVSLEKKPRRYQIEAFIEALQRNLIVVIKTGSGKTLVASMLLARMCNLNPNKMGLMIVDRVPLVFQQGDAIRRDTNLRVVSVCGENKTGHKVKQLNSNIFDVLVITAGAFYEMVTTKNELDTNLFSCVVLDECHHVSGSHRYVDVLSLFTKQRCELQPRILGLTASPVNANTIQQAENRLTQFLDKFPRNTKIFFPELPKSSTTVEELSFCRTPHQMNFIQHCLNEFNKQHYWISKILRIQDIPLLQEDLLNLQGLKGILRSLDNEYTEDYPELHIYIYNCFVLLDAIELCDVMGVPHACMKLKEDTKNEEFTDLVSNFQDCKELSRRLISLHQTLDKLSAASKTLIFVSTRQFATVLTSHLQTTFPAMKIDKVVGHNKHDGMNWEDDQKIRIKAFSGDECNLLVCTSVLEEGIDVESCDLVVCFTGVRSLISFIQARGRGRKPGSRFIVYDNNIVNEKKKTRLLQEEMMQSVLRKNQNAACYFTDMSKDIIQRIEKELTGVEQAFLDETFNVLQRDENDFPFFIYADVSSIINLEDVKADDVKIKLTEVLEEVQIFKLNRLDMISAEIDHKSMMAKIFSKETFTFLVGVQCVGPSDPLKTYQAFCGTFSYCLDFHGVKCYLWSAMKPQRSPNRDILQKFELKSFQLGYLMNMMTYCVGYEQNSIDNGDIDINIKEDINLSFSYGVGAIKVTIPKSTIGNFALLSMQKYYFTVAFCLSHCPLIEEDTDEKPYRFTILDNIEFVDAFGKYPFLLMNFYNSSLENVTAMLHAILPVPCFNVNLQEVEKKETLEVTEMSFLEDMLWSLKCFEDNRSVVYIPDTAVWVSNIFMSKKSKEEQTLIKRAVNKCCISFGNSYFQRFERLVNDSYAAFLKIPKARRCVLDDVIPPDHFLVRRAVVTPLRTVALPSIPVASNRLLRRLANTVYHIIIVSFKEEDLSKVHDCRVLRRYTKCIQDGLAINGLKYLFLLSTSSQLRDHKAYFINAPYSDVLGIRHEIIPPSNNFTCPAKYLTRLGMYGTADKNIGPLAPSQINIIDDLKARNGDLVTDGAGKIAIDMAHEVANVLGIDHIPSAFQIRYSGTKGILVTTPNHDPDLQEKSIAIRRQSMIKFHNGDENLCVSKTSTFGQFTLNREIITLLSCIPIDWQLNKTLLEYQEKALSRHSEMFNDITIAQTELRNHLNCDYVDMLESCKMEILDEKYWISILQGIYRLRVKEIKSKASIPVERSCLLIGVPDPFGVLKDNEVFVKLRSSINPIKGAILIFRNPCLHPGDVQLVTGVTNSRLMHLEDVVVLPVKDCARSLAASCSGGDLDGDQYAVIWDENLIPPKQTMYPPCNYNELATTVSQNPQNVDVTDQLELADFFGKVISNDSLGRVAHKHLALCDSLIKGARDPLAIKLAESQAQAVDFPKTGIIPIVPKAALLAVKLFPDFMEKGLSKTRPSSKILGMLYRRCRSLTYDFNIGSQGSPNMLLNMNLLVEGNEKFLSSAAEVYVSYSHDMEMLMRKFELKVEADIVLGQSTFRWSQHFEADKGKAMKAITASYDAIIHKYRELFFEDLNDQSSMHMKASAWYRIVNDDAIKIMKRPRHASMFRSFPWVVSDILCDIRKLNNRVQHSRRLLNVGETALEYFRKNSKQLLFIITEKLKKMKEIEDAVDRFTKKSYGINKAFFVFAYGSTSIYVCESESDIDICVLPKQKVFSSKIVGNPNDFKKLPNREQQQHFLQMVVLRAVDSISSEKREILNATVPIIKCSFKEGDKPIHCDISMNEEGYRKTMYIHHLFSDEHNGACYLPLFWILVRWARIAGIIRSVLNADKLIDTAEFYALIIHVLELPPADGDGSGEIKKPTRWSGIKYLYQKLDCFQFKHFFQLGNMLVDFFRKTSTMKGNVEIKWPSSQIKHPVRIDESKISTISALAGNAYHALSATRDVNAMLNYFLVISTKGARGFKRVLPLSVSYAIGKACSFHATRLSEVTGAVVSIDVEDSRNNLVVRAEGSHFALENLQNELNSLQQTNKALMLGRLPQKSSRYFMESSSIFIARGTNDEAAVLSFEDSLGAYELHHHAHQRSSVYLINNNENTGNIDVTDYNSWKQQACQKLYDHIFQQLQKFPAQNLALLESLEVTARFGCFYLVNIESCLPDSQNTIKIQDLQLAVEKGRRSRKAWKRGEFRMNYSEFGLEDSTDQTGSPRFQMVHLPPMTGGSKKFSDQVQKDIYKRKRSKSGITAAFTPGLLRSNTRDESARNFALKSYHEVLLKCGFREGQCTNRERSPAWKVSLNPSANFEVQLNLDADLNVIKVAERPLNWIHGSILDGNKQDFRNYLRTNPDIRLLFATQDVVKEGCDLYRRLLPNGELPFRVVDGKPVITSTNNVIPTIAQTKKRGRNKNFVSMIRHVQSIETFTNDTLDVCIVVGDIYFGDLMTLTRPFCEMSLYFDSRPLITAISNNFAIDENENCFRSYIQEIFDNSLKIQQELNCVLNKMK